MRPFRSLASFLAPLALVAAASAQCSLYRNGVPDFDQVRDGLPQGGGSVHCVPTSATNWMGYIANSGFPFVMGVAGPVNWQDQARHAPVTGRVELMGNLMDVTLSSGGTNGQKGLDGLKAYLFAFGLGKFTASHTYGSIFPFHIYTQVATNGLVSVCFGYHQEFNGPSGPYYVRNGGHCVTLRGIQDFCNPASTRLHLRDPATADGDDLAQSLFSTNITRVEMQTFFTNSARTESATRMRMLDYGVGSTTRRYISEMFVIRSNFTLWGPPTTAANTITISKAVALAQDLQPQQVNFNLVAASPALSAALHPDGGSAAIVCEVINSVGARVNRVYLVNLADGVQDPILDFPVGRLPIAFNRFGDLFVCDGTNLRRYDVSGRPFRVASRTLAAAPSSIAFDDNLDEVVVLTPTNRRLIRLPYDLASAIDEPLPTGVPALGDGSVIPDPSSNGKFIIAVAGSPTIHQLSIIPGTPRLQIDNSLLLPAVQEVKSLQIGDGFIQALTNLGPRTLDRDPTTARLRVAPDQPFSNLGPMRFMVMSYSRTNFDPLLHEGPAWDHIPERDQPAGVPDCPADFDGDTLLTALDIFAFLNAWFAVQPAADFNASGAIDSADIFAFLNAWFTGC